MSEERKRGNKRKAARIQRQWSGNCIKVYRMDVMTRVIGLCFIW